MLLGSHYLKCSVGMIVSSLLPSPYRLPVRRQTIIRTCTDLGVSSVERLLADGCWKDGVFTRFSDVDLQAIEEAFAKRLLAQLYKQELITDDDVASTGSAEQRRSSLRIIRALTYLSAVGLPEADGGVTFFTTKRARSSLRATLSVLSYP
jgi:hypothetical protein